MESIRTITDRMDEEIRSLCKDDVSYHQLKELIRQQSLSSYRPASELPSPHALHKSPHNDEFHSIARVHHPSRDTVFVTASDHFIPLFESNPQPMWIYDLSTLHILAVNDAAVALYGYSHDEFCTLTLRDVRPHEDVPALEDLIGRVRSSLLHDSGVWRHRTKAGQILQVKIFGYSVEFRGRFARCVQIQNVTEQYTTELRLAAVERVLAAQRHATADYWTIVSLQGIIIEQSESVKNVLGYDHNDRIGKSAYEFIHPDDIPALQYENDGSGLPEALSERRTLTYRHRHADGRWRWIESVATDMTGVPHIQGVLVSSRDVTEREEYRRALEHSEKMLRSLFVAMPDVVLILDRTGQYLDVITNHNDLLYKPSEELIGSRIDEIMPREQAALCMNVIKQALTTDHVMNMEYSLRISERETWFEAKVVPLSTERVLWVARDITERKVAEQHLRKANEQLHKLNEEKNALLEIVAHDLKNPLTGIRELAWMITNEMLQISLAEMKDLARSIHRTADRSLTFVQETLSSNAIESGTFQIVLEAVDVDMIMKQVLERYVHQAATKKLRVHYSFTANPAPLDRFFAFADEGALFQVIDNLVSNAVKYSPVGNDIWVSVQTQTLTELSAWRQQTQHTPLASFKSTSEDERYALLIVRDEGPGFSADDQEKLFERFMRLSAQPTGGEHSTGLGLSIVKRLVELMRGDVWCESTEGRGATFYVAVAAINS